MTPKEKRTVRIAGIGIAIYLVLFAGVQVWKFTARKHAEYMQLVADAQSLKDEVRRYDDRIAVVKKLMEQFHMDPVSLKKSSVVAEASSAIQKAAQGSGFQVGPVRESPAHNSGKELASIELEGSGPVKGAVGLIYRLEGLGYPLVIDSTQFSSDPMRPGQVKLKLTITILDFDQVQKAGGPHA
ncbi:MAG TPA: hypothetical protein VH413_16720 [Verrucomicrobiae bacterium]|jgi:hypothetical protein|nr:hypothetical protein [Verrucomicrobiae bacterium]